ncbi:MAG: hypothetical protein J5666_06985 [Bacilli bacterium]|nr:hypothetical protein [Bacilli bacterium]
MIGVIFALISSVAIQNPAYDYTNALSLQHAGTITTGCFDETQGRVINASFDFTFYSLLNYDNSDDYNVYFTKVECTLTFTEDENVIDSYFAQYNINTPYIQSPYNYLELAPVFSGLNSSCILTGTVNSNTLFTLQFNNLFIDSDYWFLLDEYSWNLSFYINSAQSLIKNGNVYGTAYNDGYRDGKQEGYDNGKADGYQEGYADGWYDADNVDESTLAIFEGIITIALVPINFFLAIFNFEIFGINLSGFVSALLTVSIIIIVIRFITGKKQGSDD